MNETYETGGRAAVANLATKQPYELLLLLGGALSVLLSLVLLGIEWYQGTLLKNLATYATIHVVDVVLGAGLWVSSAVARKNLVNGAIVAGIVSVILIAFGGQAGLIGGVAGLLGAILAAASPYMPTVRHR